MMPRAHFLLCLLCLSSLAPAGVGAQARAWLDRDRVALGETATLNVETDRAGATAPDYSALEADFVLSGHSSRTSFEAIAGGGSRARSLFAVALRPRREGVLIVPSLRIGSSRTTPLSMTVTAAVPARAGGDIFIEAEADHASPYVQQVVGYVIRLYYATPLVSGQLDQDPPTGASLRRVGTDLQYTRDLGGRRYNVVERRFTLVPERSGALEMPQARFEGVGVAGFFDDFFGGGQRRITASGPRRVLDVQAVPAAASQPWLPLHGLTLRYLDAPRQAQVGEAVDVVVELTADGADASQLPELRLATGAGAEVFVEPAKVDESFDRGRPQVRVTRRFSVVPGRAGPLRLAMAGVEWWDVRAGRPRTASLADIALEVAAAPGDATKTATGGLPAAKPGDPAGASGPAGDRWIRVPGIQGEVRPWALAAVVFALLWLATLAWGLHRTPPSLRAEDAGPRAVSGAGTRAGSPATSPAPGAGALRRALSVGTLGEVADALCAMARPPLGEAEGIASRLADPAQVAAVAAMQRARWADGDGVAAREALRKAFAKGPRWRRAEAGAHDALLPPLYPSDRGRDPA